ncbi:class I SAM-dependent methyltransferase [Paraburkholderia sartisoli]|uniref:Methyltransferase domain-containing protein n=1 Tax=Paraburkholderia sartisoli TaxID=83784 RepID=A0A1H4G0J0_9BURK|nr:class I SAM-dependent methyltransferase [Paraburkholderia sartisoli]SEB02917.1 Methyltransferase domain-containing protein [Paraburkholderia sartisoli]
MTALRELYRANNLPVFQNRMYDTEAEARSAPVGDVHLVEDLTTGLVYNNAFRPELIVYDEHYQNEQAVSAHFRKHLEAVAEIVTRTLGTRSIVEVACGKGYFLEMLAERGFDITGFDPAYEGSNPAIEKRYFASDAGVAGDGLVLRHVLEHVKDPVAFLERIRDANGGRGRIYIEVPCFEWICEHAAWFDIFYEHVNYFRPVDFERMFGVVHESGHLFGGQYQYVVADLASLRTPRYDAGTAVRFPADLGVQKSRNVTDGSHSNGGIVWGGASKGVIFALQCAREGLPVSAVIDINPAKQGRYLPTTGLKVKSPDEVLPDLAPGATIYVMNSNYLDEIRAQAGAQFNYIGIDS